MARGRLEKEERETYERDEQCRLVYQNGIVGAIVALLDTPFVGYIQPAQEYGTTQSFLSFTLRDSFHFSSLALIQSRVIRTGPGEGEEEK